MSCTPDIIGQKIPEGMYPVPIENLKTTYLKGKNANINCTTIVDLEKNNLLIEGVFKTNNYLSYGWINKKLTIIIYILDENQKVLEREFIFVYPNKDVKDSIDFNKSIEYDQK